MANVQVFVVHDALGAISSIGRPTEHARIKVTVLSGEGQSVLRTEVDEDAILGAISSQRVDLDQNSLVKY